MKYRIDIYDIAGDRTDSVEFDGDLSEFRSGDWSCDCRRQSVFKDLRGKADFRNCCCVGFVVVGITECATGMAELDLDQYNAGYCDMAKTVARKRLSKALRPTSVPTSVPFFMSHPKPPAATDEIDEAIGIKKVETEEQQLVAIKAILRKWDPEKLVTAGQNDDEYDHFAVAFSKWIRKRNTARDFAIQVAARFNHMMCLCLNDNGQFEFIRPQSYTTEGCMPVAMEMRQACGILDRLQVPRVVDWKPAPNLTPIQGTRDWRHPDGSVVFGNVFGKL